MICNGFQQASLPRVCLQRTALIAVVYWEVATQLPVAIWPSSRELLLIAAVCLVFL